MSAAAPLAEPSTSRSGVPKMRPLEVDVESILSEHETVSLLCQPSGDDSEKTHFMILFEWRSKLRWCGVGGLTGGCETVSGCRGECGSGKEGVSRWQRV